MSELLWQVEEADEIFSRILDEFHERNFYWSLRMGIREYVEIPKYSCLLRRKYQPKQAPPLFELVEKNNLKVVWEKPNKVYTGQMDLSDRKITLTTEDPSVFLHELVHWYDFKEGRMTDSVENEIVAEFAALILARKFGVSNESISGPYIWSQVTQTNSEDPTMEKYTTEEGIYICRRLQSRILSAVREILSDASPEAFSWTPLGWY